MDPNSKYLQATLGTVLTRCVADVCQVQPRDPIEYMALWLYREADAEVYFHEKQIFRQETEQLLLQFQKEQERKHATVQKINKKMAQLEVDIRQQKLKQFSAFCKGYKNAHFDFSPFKGEPVQLCRLAERPFLTQNMELAEQEMETKELAISRLEREQELMWRRVETYEAMMGVINRNQQMSRSRVYAGHSDPSRRVYAGHSNPSRRRNKAQQNFLSYWRTRESSDLSSLSYPDPNKKTGRHISFLDVDEDDITYLNNVVDDYHDAEYGRNEDLDSPEIRSRQSTFLSAGSSPGGSKKDSVGGGSLLIDRGYKMREVSREGRGSLKIDGHMVRHTSSEHDEMIDDTYLTSGREFKEGRKGFDGYMTRHKSREHDEIVDDLDLASEREFEGGMKSFDGHMTRHKDRDGSKKIADTEAVRVGKAQEGRKSLGIDGHIISRKSKDESTDTADTEAVRVGKAQEVRKSLGIDGHIISRKSKDESTDTAETSPQLIGVLKVAGQSFSTDKRDSDWASKHAYFSTRLPDSEERSADVSPSRTHAQSPAVSSQTRPKRDKESRQRSDKSEGRSRRDPFDQPRSRRELISKAQDRREPMSKERSRRESMSKERSRSESMNKEHSRNESVSKERKRSESLSKVRSRSESVSKEHKRRESMSGRDSVAPNSEDSDPLDVNLEGRMKMRFSKMPSGVVHTLQLSSFSGNLFPAPRERSETSSVTESSYSSRSSGSQSPEHPRQRRVVQCHWSLEDGVHLVCRHPVLGKISSTHPRPLGLLNSPHYWKAQKFDCNSLYDPELYNCPDPPESLPTTPQSPAGKKWTGVSKKFFR